jgi:hypothetical protein
MKLRTFMARIAAADCFVTRYRGTASNRLTSRLSGTGRGVAAHQGANSLGGASVDDAMARAWWNVSFVVCRSLVATLTALTLFAASAIAQQADRPDVRVGDEWQFAVYYTVASGTPNRTWVITSVAAAGVEGTENGEPLRLTRELNVIESPREKSSNPRLLAFPLEVGKRWQYVNDWLFKPKGSQGKSVVDVAVVGYEKITVPAGEFEAFKLTSKETLSGRSPIGSQYAGETIRTYWYAPAARAIVKSVSHNPYLGPTTVELVTFQLRP